MKERTILKNISLTTAILLVIFMVLVVIYQTTSSHQDLAADLTIAFSALKK